MERALAVIEAYTPEDLAHFLRRRDLLRRAERGEITADQACAALGIRPISGGALPVTLSITQVASTDSPANAPTVFDTNVFKALEDLFGIPDALAVGRSLLRSVLAGCQLSNDGTSPNTVIDVSAGIAMSSDNLLLMDIGAFTGSTGGIWATGSGSNKMDTSTAVAAATWYHVFVIGGGGNATDILFSLSATAPTLPTGYTKQRRIGSFRTAAATTNILAFVQDGDLFQWTNPTTLGLDISSGTAPGTAASTRTLNVPTGVNVTAIILAQLSQGATRGALYLSDLATTDVAAAAEATPLGVGIANANGNASAQVQVRTNTLGQIRARVSFSDASVQYYLQTTGWIDRRGRDL